MILSAALHLALIWLVPAAMNPGGKGNGVEETGDPGTTTVAVAAFDPSMKMDLEAGTDPSTTIAPLPLAEMQSAMTAPMTVPPVAESDTPEQSTESDETSKELSLPTFADLAKPKLPSEDTEMDDLLGDMLDQLEPSDDPETNTASEPAPAETVIVDTVTPEPTASEIFEQRPAIETVAETDSPKPITPQPDAAVTRSINSAPATTAGSLNADFANRVGQAKADALRDGGGDISTERAVELALEFLTQVQRTDGGWSSAASGGGRERVVLGENRGGAGARADMAITGLALLAMAGAGNTHQDGPYSKNVYSGLAYLIRNQAGNGSMAGNASTYASTYSHGMAALAMGEIAAITRDTSAIESTRRAVLYTTTIQHATTGGWRYRPGDPGDLSQLGWQAMVIDAGHRAGLVIPARNLDAVDRFLRSVRAGTSGGLASYRPGEAPSRTMTAEALATRLLLGQKVPAAEIAEAERYLLQQKPGTGADNYYYWYYATLALHQLQDDAWSQWNVALKNRLIETQNPNGSWSSETVWGSYGGTIYTTAMATLCLETYYRHQVRSDASRLANRPDASPTNTRTFR